MLETVLQGITSRAVCSYGKLEVRRNQWCRRLGLGWLELSPASTLAVAGARVSLGSTLRWPGRLVRGTYVLYVAQEGS